MKKLILILLLIPSLCMAADPIDWSKPYARMGVVTMGAGVAAASCGTNAGDFMGTTDAATYWADASGDQSVATYFVATSDAGTICQVDAEIYLYDVSTNLTAYVSIWSDHATNHVPDSRIGNESVGIPYTSMGTSAGVNVSFTWSGASGITLTNGTGYWLVARADSTNGAHPFYWMRNTVQPTYGSQKSTHPAVTWGQISTGQYRFKLYK